MISAKVHVKNEGPKFRILWEKKKEEILYALGLKWQEVATKIITIKIYSEEKPWKLTGRLRGSLSFATPKQQGPRKGVSANRGNDYITSSSPNSVTVGSNVVYANKVNRKHQFLEESVLNYRSSFGKLAKKIMQQ